MFGKVKRFIVRKSKEEAVRIVENELLHTEQGRERLGKFIGKLLMAGTDFTKPAHRKLVENSLQQMLISGANYAKVNLGDLAYIMERVTLKIKEAAISQMGTAERS